MTTGITYSWTADLSLIYDLGVPLNKVYLGGGLEACKNFRDLSLDSWLIHAKPRSNALIETTDPRVAYFGFEMNYTQASDFETECG